MLKEARPRESEVYEMSDASDDSDNDDYISELRKIYVDDYKSNNATDILKTSFDVWRFGLGYRKGYGYNFSNLLILPYHTMGFVWNRSQFIHPFDKIRVFDGKILRRK